MLVIKKGTQQSRKTPMMTPTVMVALCSSTRLWLIWGLVTYLLALCADIRLSLSLSGPCDPDTESLLS